MKKSYYKNKVCFSCEMCGFLYEDEEDAKTCEDWCTKYHTCNLELTKKAMNNK